MEKANKDKDANKKKDPPGREENAFSASCAPNKAPPYQSPAITTATPESRQITNVSQNTVVAEMSP